MLRRRGIRFIKLPSSGNFCTARAIPAHKMFTISEFAASMEAFAEVLGRYTRTLLKANVIWLRR